MASNVRDKTINSIVLLSMAIIAIVVFWVIPRLIFPRPNLDMPSAIRDATALIAKAGGADEVCKEADQLFHRYPTTNSFYLFQDSDLKDFPAIMSLGRVNGIWSGPPNRIRVRVGTHFDGYAIEILETNLPERYDKSPNEAEIVKSRIFVHR
jgi:hypothetical protein